MCADLANMRLRLLTVHKNRSGQHAQPVKTQVDK